MSLYTAYFGLDQAPFSIAPDPRYLFPTERHREALAHLVYGLEGGGGFVLLTGDIGTGKTTVCRRFLDQIPSHCNVAYIFNPRLTVRELLQSVCEELHIPANERPASAESEGNKAGVDALNRYLLAQHAQGRNTVLIIDEAQNLAADVLEQLRLLTNLETTERKLLQIVLIGQPELREMLARPELEQLAQRITARYHLGALTAQETRAYIAHRLTVAGLNRPLPFDAAALTEVHRRSGGVPRRINLLCDRALLGTFARGMAQVDAATVAQSAREVMGSDAGHARKFWAWVALALAALAAAAALGWWAARVGAAGSPPAGAKTGPNASAPMESSSQSATGDAGRRAPLLAASVASSKASAVRPAGQSAASAPRAGLAASGATAPAVDGSLPVALVALGQGHGLALRGEEACAGSVAPGWRCWRRKVDVDLVRRLHRPLIVFLRQPRGTVQFARVAQWDGEALLALADGRTVKLSSAQWQASWTGDVIGLWRVPPGWQAEPTADRLPQATRVWLAQRLDAAQMGVAPESSRTAPSRAGPASAPASASVGGGALAESLRRFQRANGLAPDGRLRPVTVMLLERAGA